MDLDRHQPRTTQWITYSQRPKSRRRFKSNFATWTRLGLFTTVYPLSWQGGAFPPGLTWFQTPRESDEPSWGPMLLPSSEASASIRPRGRGRKTRAMTAFGVCHAQISANPKKKLKASYPAAVITLVAVSGWSEFFAGAPKGTKAGRMTNAARGE
jgi:hypothetical protein